MGHTVPTKNPSTPTSSQQERVTSRLWTDTRVESKRTQEKGEGRQHGRAHSTDTLTVPNTLMRSAASKSASASSERPERGPSVHPSFPLPSPDEPSFPRTDHALRLDRKRQQGYTIPPLTHNVTAAAPTTCASGSPVGPLATRANGRRRRR